VLPALCYPVERICGFCYNFQKGLSLDPILQTELWTSWASMLRVYAAAHSLASEHHAVVEVGAEEIVLRFGNRWVRFTHSEQTGSDGRRSDFQFNEDGSVTCAGTTEEMDMAAESVARKVIQQG
jgi:hypothetical protein